MKKLNWMAAIVGLFIFGALTQVHAGKWQKEHPRRAQVNRRLNNQNARINAGVKSGKLT